MPTNLQYEKAGNIGDIIKHAALVNGLKILERRSGGRKLNYVDMHSFLLNVHLPTERALAWKAECSKLISTNPVYKNYYELELSYIGEGFYHCSSNLAIDTLATTPDMYLAEIDQATRGLIHEQMRSIKKRPYYVLLNDCSTFNSYKVRDKNAPLFILVDPFLESESDWVALWDIVCNFVKNNHNKSGGIIEIYKYQRSENVSWPKPPKGMVGPNATISKYTGSNDSYHHIAVYSTPSTSSAVIEVLTEMGWSI